MQCRRLSYRSAASVTKYRSGPKYRSFCDHFRQIREPRRYITFSNSQ